MADKRREYYVVAVYWPDGNSNPKSWCNAETETLAVEIERVFRRYYSERDGFRLVTYQVGSHAEAFAFRPPPLQNTPDRCEKRRTAAPAGSVTPESSLLKHPPKATYPAKTRAGRGEPAAVAAAAG